MDNEPHLIKFNYVSVFQIKPACKWNAKTVLVSL